MSYHIAEKPAMRFIGIRTRLTENVEENQRLVPEFWRDTLRENLFSDICALSSKPPKGILGISVYENPDNIFYYIAVASDKETPEQLLNYEIPATTWVVFENDGYFKENVQDIFRRFYTEWLPFSGYEYAGLPDIEVYPIIHGKPVSGHSEVWIAIRKEKERK